MSNGISPSSAAELLATMARSIRNDPAQFYTLHINVGPVSNVVGGQGPVNISATSVGSSGDTTGAIFEASVSTGDIRVAAWPAEEEFQQRFLIAADLLNDIAAELKQAAGDSRTIRSKLAKLTELAIPAFVVEVARQLIRAAGIAIT